MFVLSFDEACLEICEKTGLDENTINLKVENKMAELGGLVSKQGAVHIVANELGVKLASTLSSGDVKIGNLFVGMRRANILARVMVVYNVSNFTYKKTGEPGKVLPIMLADDTGRIRTVLWDTNLISLFEEGKVKAGDVVRAEAGYVRSSNNGSKELHMGSYSKFDLNPEIDSGVNLPSISELNETVFERANIASLSESVQQEVLATIVQFYDRAPFYESCPICRKSLREGKCPNNHSFEKNSYSLRVSTVLDDGSGSILSLFFGKSAEILLSMSTEEVVSKAKELGEPEKLTDFLSKRLLGKQVLVRGVAKKNELSGALEFITRFVLEPEPKAETSNLLN